jgi:hypothetical protein
MFTTSIRNPERTVTIVPLTNETEARRSALPERFHSISKPLAAGNSLLPRELGTTTEPQKALPNAETK